MKSIIDELRCSEQDQPLSEAAVSHVTTMNTLYCAGLITENELRIGLGGKSIGAAGDRFASENSSPIAHDRFDIPQPEGVWVTVTR